MYVATANIESSPICDGKVVLIVPLLTVLDKQTENGGKTFIFSDSRELINYQWETGKNGGRTVGKKEITIEKLWTQHSQHATVYCSTNNKEVIAEYAKNAK
jgi:hypothetical protein